VTGTGDEVIMSSQAILATFKNIKGDNFKLTTEAVLDMATVMKTDLKSAALQLGKALNDPVTQMSALTRSGVSFTEKQKEMVKQFVEQNKLGEAQTLILKELRSQFGGAAKAAGQTLGGQMKRLAAGFGDVEEKIGIALIPAFEEFVKYGNDHVIPFLDRMFSKTGTGTKKIKDLSGGLSAGAELAGKLGINKGLIEEADKIIETSTTALGKLIAPAFQTFERPKSAQRAPETIVGTNAWKDQQLMQTYMKQEVDQLIQINKGGVQSFF